MIVSKPVKDPQRRAKRKLKKAPKDPLGSLKIQLTFKSR